MPARIGGDRGPVEVPGRAARAAHPGRVHPADGARGRRGIDELGHAVVVLQRNVAFERVASLASTRTYELTSSFRPSYNMAVNLVRNYTRDEAHHLLNSSFAQFLADRGRRDAGARARTRPDRSSPAFREQMRCHLGDFAEYWALREKAMRPSATRFRKGRERARTEAIREGLAALRPGDVIFVPRARRRGLAVVLSVREGRPTVLAQDRTVLPAGHAGLPGAARGPDQDPAAAVGERSERPVPPRPGGASSSRWTFGPARSHAAASTRKVEREAAQIRAPGGGAPVPRVPGPAGARALGRRAPRRSTSRSAGSTAGSEREPRRSPGSSNACSRCSRSSGTCAGSRSSRRGGRWRGSTARATS